jgi:hypothetical protein
MAKIEGEAAWMLDAELVYNAFGRKLTTWTDRSAWANRKGRADIPEIGRHLRRQVCDL